MSAAPASPDSFKCRKTLKVGAKTYAYFSLPDAEKNGLAGVSRLPVSLKVLLENLLRFEDGRSVKDDDIAPSSLAEGQGLRARDRLPPRPRADAGLHRRAGRGRPRRHARRHEDGSAAIPTKINPLVPVDLVIDHSVQVDYFGTADAFEKNVEARVRAQPRALRVPALGPVGLQ